MKDLKIVIEDKKSRDNLILALVYGGFSVRVRELINREHGHTEIIIIANIKRDLV